MCKEYNLSCGGKCEDLYERLINHLNEFGNQSIISLQ